MGLIPLPWKLAGIAILALMLTGAYFAWQHHQRALGAAEVEKSNLQAIALQLQKDASLNKALAIKYRARITQLESVAQAAGQKIDMLPVDPGSPADEAAAAAVNCMLEASTCAK